MSELKQLEDGIVEAQGIIEYAKKVEALEAIPEFTAVITDGYHKDEVMRLVSALCKAREIDRADLYNRLLGISFSMENLNTAKMMKDLAKQRIADLEEAIHELNSEEAN